MKIFQTFRHSTALTPALATLCWFAVSADANAQQIITAGDTYHISTDGLIADTTNVQADGRLNIDLSDTIGALTGSGTVDISTGQTLTTNGPSQTSSFSGILSGGGTFTKSGRDVLALTGNNTHTGQTIVSSGTLRVQAYSQSTSFQVDRGATLDLSQNRQADPNAINKLDVSSIVNNGKIETNRDAAIGSLSGSGDLRVNLATLTVGANNSSTVFSGSLLKGSAFSRGPSCNVKKVGTGTLTLTGVNECDGRLTVAGGTLALGYDRFLYRPDNYALNAIDVDNGATLLIDTASSRTAPDADLYIASGGTVTIADSRPQFANAVPNSFAVRTLSGSGNLNLNSPGSIDLLANGSAVFSGVISGIGGLRKYGSNPITLTGNNTYTGPTLIREGTLALLGSNTSPLYAISRGGKLQIDPGADILDSAIILLDGSFDVNTSDTIGSLAGAGLIDIADKQTLTTGAANRSTTFSGIISGQGALIKSGNGTLMLSGANTHTGGTTVAGGTLAVFGALQGSTLVQSGATLSGTGVLADLTVQDGGIFAPGTSIGTIATGNLTLASGATLKIDVDDTGKSDLVNVTGSVSINNATLDVIGAAGSYTGAPYRYTIIANDDTDPVTGSFGTVTENLAFLDAAVEYQGGDGNDVVLTLTETETFVLDGAPPNLENVGHALDDVDRTPGSPGDELIQKILMLTHDQARKTHSDLAGDIHANSTQSMFDIGGNLGGQIGERLGSLANNGSGSTGFGTTAALQLLNSGSNRLSFFSADLAPENRLSRQDALGYGKALRDADDQLQLWGGVSGYHANLESDGNAQGTSSSGFGAVFGMDRSFGNRSWGGALGYGKTTSRAHDDRSEMDVNSFSAALYTQHKLGQFNLNGLAAYTYHQIDGRRTISNINATARSDYSAHQFTLQSEISRRFSYDHNKDITPFLLGRYMNLSTSGYRETGAGSANLTSSGEVFWSLDLVLGARMHVALNQKTNLTFGAGYSYRFGDTQPEITQSFSGGSSFTTTGIARNRHSAFLEAGFEKAFSERAKFIANANAQLTDTHHAIGGNIGFQIQF